MASTIFFFCGLVAFAVSAVASWDAIDTIRVRGWRRAYLEAVPWGMIALFFLLLAWHAFKVAFS